MTRTLIGSVIKNDRGLLSQVSGNPAGPDGDGLELDLGLSSSDATPPTPSTPMTPPHDSGEDTNSVFMTMPDELSLNGDFGGYSSGR